MHRPPSLASTVFIASSNMYSRWTSRANERDGRVEHVGERVRGGRENWPRANNYFCKGCATVMEHVWRGADPMVSRISSRITAGSQANATWSCHCRVLSSVYSINRRHILVSTKRQIRFQDETVNSGFICLVLVKL